MLPVSAMRLSRRLQENHVTYRSRKPVIEGTIALTTGYLLLVSKAATQTTVVHGFEL